MPDMRTKIRTMKVHGPSKDKDLNGSTNLLDEGDSSLKEQKALGNKCDGVSKTSSFCQSRPRGLFQLIEKFNITQKDDIRSIEFGGLLHLHLKKKCSSPSMLLWLIEHFNHNNRMMELFCLLMRKIKKQVKRKMKKRNRKFCCRS